MSVLSPRGLWQATAETVKMRNMLCTSCGELYTAQLEEQEFTPLMVGGPARNPKHACPKCGKAAGLPAITCQACKEKIPTPGMAGMSAQNPRMRAVCPKCKKPITGLVQ